MPIGGETVGRAYVRILADGSELPGGIRDELEKAEPGVREAGRDHGRTYAEEFDKERKKSFKGQFGKTQKEFFDDINKALTTSLAKLDLADSFFKNKNWTEFRNRLTDEFGDAGHRAGIRMEQRLKDAADLEGLAPSIERIGVEVRRALKEIEDAEEKYLSDRNAAYAEQDRRLRAETEKALRERQRLERAYQMNKQFDLARERKSMSEIVKLLRTLTVETEALEKGERRLGITRKRALEDFSRLEGLLTHLPGGPDDRLSFEIERVHKRLIDVQPRAARFNRTIDLISSRLGKATGRGSRNDFIHLIGGVTEGISRLLFLGPRLVTNFVSKITGAFTGATGALDKFGKVTQAIGTSIGSAVLGFAGLVVAASVLLIALGPVVALISGLLGIITALASTITFALIGGLVALGGALVPVVAGIGAVVLGIATMGDDLKDKVGAQLTPVTNQFKELGGALREGLFNNVPEQAQNVARALDGLTPVASRLGDAISDVATSWTDALDSKGFRDFSERLEFFIPRNVRRLGEIAENTGSALGGMFEAAMPFISNFLKNLVNLTDRWDEWANSVGGKNAVKDFLDKAADSADSLGGFLGSVVGLVAELFDAGNKTGNNLFDDMANAVDNLTQHLQENPDALKNWFANAEDLGQKIGDLVVAVGHLFDELDNEQNRQALLDIIDLFTDLPEALADLEDKITPVLGPITDLLGLVADLYELSQKDVVFDISFGDLLNAPLWAIGKIIEGVRELSNLHVDWGGLLSGVADIPNKVSLYFRGLGRKIIGAVGNIPWGRISEGANRLPGQIVGFFGGLAGKILGAIGKINWSRLADGANRLPGQIVNFFAGLAGKILEKIIPIKWSRLGEGLKDFISTIPGMFVGLGAQIISAIGNIVVDVIPNILGSGREGNGGGEWAAGGIAGLANGAVVHGPAFRLIGEAGPEAVVPLNRPLSQVDPSVRWLSAIAQGLDGVVEGMASGGRAGKTIDASGWTIVTPQSDARAVANETLNYLVATSYTA